MDIRSCLASLVIVLVSLLPLRAVIPPQQVEGIPWQYYWQESLAAYQKKDFASFLENAKRAAATGPPRHPGLLLNLARAHSLAGERAEAVKLLEEVLDMGFGAADAARADFDPVRDTDAFRKLAGKIEAVRAPVVNSSVAFTIPEKDLIPEGIACDPVGGRFYVGSLHKAKIVSLDRAGRKRDFKHEREDGLSGVLGMRVDARRRILWVNTAVLPELKGYSKEEDGTAALHKYDLRTGRLLRKYDLANKPTPHLLNDIAINAAGELFITDSLSSIVYRLRNGKDSLEEFVRFKPYSYPNGITLSDDGRQLFVAHAEGISLIEVSTGKVSALASAPGISLFGIDGLYYYRNSLIGVQNFSGDPLRVVRFHLDRGGQRVERVRVMEANHPLFNIPTTGAVAGSSFYFIANSQLRSFDAQGKIFPTEKLSDVVILRTKLRDEKR